MSITPLPTPPAITDSTSEFNTKAFAWVEALDGFTTEANAVAQAVNDDAAEVAAAALDAAAIEAIYTQLGPVFLGAAESDPTVDNEGNALIEGAIYFNTIINAMKIYNGDEWQVTGEAIPVTFVSNTFSGTGAQTAFTLSAIAYGVDAVQVYISGVRQTPTTDYTVSDTTLTFTTAPPSGTNNIYVLSVTPVNSGVPDDNSVSTAKIQNDAVTFAKMQNITTARLLGRSTAGTGDPEELTAGAGLTIAGGALSATAGSDSAPGVVELATAAEVRTGTDTGRVPAVASLRDGLIVNATAQSVTGQTVVNFADIPSWVKRIAIMFSGVSLSGTDQIIFKLGDSGGLESAGYVGAVAFEAANAAFSTYFQVTLGAAAGDLISGAVDLFNLDGNTWVMKGIMAGNGGEVSVSAGSKTLSATLTQLSIDTPGTNTFDAGTINISYF